MRIALFDFKVAPTNPIGGCHHRMLQTLCHEHDFTVFATEFENPNPGRIKFVRVRVPTRPLALAFVMYQLMAPICYWLHKLFTGARFDIVQSVESNVLIRADVDYSQFCHRRFLKVHWHKVKGSGLRAVLRKLDHRLRSLTEPFVYRWAGQVVVASWGMQRELSAEYPVTADKITVLANPVDIPRMQRPADFDRSAKRRELGYSDTDVVLSFLALGHYERKGLPLLMQALVESNNPSLKLLVVGGENDLTRSYRRKAAAMGLAENQVQFVGMQRDVRPFLWASDAFALPSGYEVFSLAVLEAAAASLPLIVTMINGVEEFVRDGVNGIVVERSVAGIRQGLDRFLAMSEADRAALGRHARDDVRRYSVDEFNAGWRKIYQRFSRSTGF